MAVQHPAVGKYCVIRGENSGVFAGMPITVENKNIELSNVRRIWSWEGALSCSEISQEGITAGKLSVVTPSHFLSDMLEIIPTSKKAEKCLRNLV